MKALLLAPQPYYSDRGTPMNVRAMLEVLSEAGVLVDMLTYPLGQDTPMPGLTFHRVVKPPGIKKIPIGPSPIKLVLDSEMLPKAWLMARRGGYALVHAIEESVFIGLLLRKCFRIPLLYDMDSSLKDQLANYGIGRSGIGRSFFGYCEKSAITHSDGVITVCGALTDLVRSIDPRRRVYQIEDIPLRPADRETPADAEKLLAAMTGKKVLLYTGNGEPYQGLPLLVAALPLILVEHPDALLMLVGVAGDPAEDLAAQAKRLGVGSALFMTPPRPPGQMWWFMERAAALLSPRCLGNNTPLKIYTYLESGKPIVATRMPTHTQVLDDECSELTAPTAQAFAAGVIALLKNPSQAAAKARRGGELVAERYSREFFREKLLKAYAEVGGFVFSGLGRAGSKSGAAGEGGPLRPAVFLDRDGVINRRAPGGYVTKWPDFHFLPGVPEAIKTFNALGYATVVVTNQQGVGKKLMTQESLDDIHRRMTEETACRGGRLDGVYSCPHLEGSGCECRKPKAGMILRAAQEMGLDLGRSYMAGDADSDCRAALSAGCRPVFIGRPEDAPPDCPAYPDLLSFARALESDHPPEAKTSGSSLIK